MQGPCQNRHRKLYSYYDILTNIFQEMDLVVLHFPTSCLDIGHTTRESLKMSSSTLVSWWKPICHLWSKICNFYLMLVVTVIFIQLINLHRVQRDGPTIQSLFFWMLFRNQRQILVLRSPPFWNGDQIETNRSIMWFLGEGSQEGYGRQVGLIYCK